MPVVSMAGGTQVGKVADVLLDAASLRVVALLLSARVAGRSSRSTRSGASARMR